MFIIDDLLAAPMRSLIFVLKKVNQAVNTEREAQERSLMAELTALHRALDRNEITEAAFDEREQILLGRLDRLHAEDESDDGADDRS
ncbi:MAG: gas vesicle protein GvpG [Azospirillaceae bacterium]|nr:gas vesicle protein GvpG [Azospirillaceae bacterium]